MELVPGAGVIFICQWSLLGVETRWRTRSPGTWKTAAIGCFIRSVQADDGPTGSGSHWIRANAPITKVFQLETRSNSGGHQCIHTELESDSWICKPSLVSIANTDDTDQSLSGQC